MVMLTFNVDKNNKLIKYIILYTTKATILGLLVKGIIPLDT